MKREESLTEARRYGGHGGKRGKGEERKGRSKIYVDKYFRVVIIKT